MDKFFKRLVTCWRVFIMPPDGVDESFESAKDMLQYWREQKKIDYLYYLTPKPEPTKITAVVTKVVTRPPLYIEDE